MAMSLPHFCFETILPGCVAARGRRVVGVDWKDRIDSMGGIDGMDFGGGE